MHKLGWAHSVNVGANLKAAREVAGLSQATLAEGLMSAAHLSLIEAGKRSPSTRMLEALAEKLNVHIELLLHGIDGHAMAAQLDALGQLMDTPDEAVITATALLNDPSFSHDPNRRARARYMRGIAHERVGMIPEAIEDLREAVAMLPADFVPAEVLQLGVDYVRSFRIAGRFEESLEAALGFVNEVPQELIGSPVHARMLASTAGCYYWLDRSSEGLDLIKSSLPLFDDAERGEGRGYLLWNGLVVCDGVGNLELAMQWGEEALALLAPLDLPPGMVASLKTSLALVCRKAAVPDLDRATQLFLEAHETLRQVGNMSNAGAAQNELAYIAWLQGHMSEAMRWSAEAMSTLEPFGDTVHMIDALHTRARIEASLGNFEELNAAIANAIAVEAEHESTGLHAGAWRAVGDDLRKLGRVDEALVCLERALVHARINE